VASQVVLLDAGRLGIATNASRSWQSIACAQWLQVLVTRGTRVDVNLAAQVITLGVTDAVIATTDVGHLSRFAPAALWPDITAT
jgi:hypothetical protein